MAKTIQEVVIDQLKRQLAEAHDAFEHKFTPSEDDPAVCAICGWINPEGEKHKCGHTTREHAQKLLDGLKAGEIKVGIPILIEISVIDI